MGHIRSLIEYVYKVEITIGMKLINNISLYNFKKILFKQYCQKKVSHER